MYRGTKNITNGISYNRPWMILISDGCQMTHGTIADDCREAENKNKE